MKRKRELERKLADERVRADWFWSETLRLQRLLGEIADSKKNSDKFLDRWKLHGVAAGRGCSNPMCEGCHGGG